MHGQRTTRKSAAAKRARTAAIVLSASFVVVQGVLRWLAEYPYPVLNNPEFGRKWSLLVPRLSDSRDASRPLVLFIGTSRGSFGFSPNIACAEFTIDGKTPYGANLSQNGTNYWMQYLAFQEALARGADPKMVVFELKSDHLVADAGSRPKIPMSPYYREAMFLRDWPTMRSVVPGELPDVPITFWWEKLTPVFHLRGSLTHQISRNLCLDMRVRGNHVYLEGVDEAGWYRYPARLSTPEKRQSERDYWYPRIAFPKGTSVDPLAEIVYGKLADECRTRGIALVLVYLPEASDFREDLVREVCRFPIAVAHRRPQLGRRRRLRRLSPPPRRGGHPLLPQTGAGHPRPVISNAECGLKVNRFERVLLDVTQT
jgi:hypothetical protein